MRSIVEGRVTWSFWPPGSSPPAGALGILTQDGNVHKDEDDAPSSEDDRAARDSEKEESSDQDVLAGTDDEDEAAINEAAAAISEATTSRFAALGVTEDSEDEDEE